MRLNRKFRAFTPILPHLTHIARTHVNAFIKIKVLQVPYKSSTCLIVVARWSRNPWDKFRKEATNSCHPSGKQQSSNDMVMGWKRERLGKERELYIFKNGIFRQILIRFPGFFPKLQHVVYCFSSLQLVAHRLQKCCSGADNSDGYDSC